MQEGPGKGRRWKRGRGLGPGQLRLAGLPPCLRPGCFLLGALEDTPAPQSQCAAASVSRALSSVTQYTTITLTPFSALPRSVTF